MCVHSRRVNAVHRQLLPPMHHVPRISIALSAWLLNLHPSCGISLEVRRITWFYWNYLSCSWFWLTLKCESIVPDFSKNGSNSAQISARFKKWCQLCQTCVKSVHQYWHLCLICAENVFFFTKLGNIFYNCAIKNFCHTFYLII
jgi:hypothetical protein